MDSRKRSATHALAGRWSWGALWTERILASARNSARDSCMKSRP